MMFHDAFSQDTPKPKGARPLVYVAWFLALLVLCFAGVKANAHSAPSGAMYEYIPCCSNRDCAPIPDTLVHEMGGGLIVVRVPPGAHPMHGKEKTNVLVLEFEGEKIRKPLDGSWHVCISPSGTPLCVYPPLRGF